MLAALSADERRRHDALEEAIAGLRASRSDVEKIHALYDVGPAPLTHMTPDPGSPRMAYVTSRLPRVTFQT